MRSIIFSLVVLALSLLSVSVAAAQDAAPDPGVVTPTTIETTAADEICVGESCDDIEEAISAAAPFIIGFVLVMLVLVVVTTGFWLWMLIHAAGKPIEDRVLWILILVFLGFIGAIIYYFAVKRPFDKVHATQV